MIKAAEIFKEIHENDVKFICFDCKEERLLYLELGFKSAGGKKYCKECTEVK